jgi:hypothetical protein
MNCSTAQAVMNGTNAEPVTAFRKAAAASKLRECVVKNGKVQLNTTGKNMLKGSAPMPNKSWNPALSVSASNTKKVKNNAAAWRASHPGWTRTKSTSGAGRYYYYHETNPAKTQWAEPAEGFVPEEVVPTPPAEEPSTPRPNA